MIPTIYYCYDAYCGWCYGFSHIIKKTHDTYSKKIAFEVLSGGMIIHERPRPISLIADYIQQTYKNVEMQTGIEFGDDFLWHINHSELSDWFPNSEKPAIALCIFKEYYEDRQIDFAVDLQYSLYYEGRDLCDDEAYKHLLKKYNIQPQEFYDKLHSESYKNKAYDEFNLCKQLKVTGFPQVFLQVSESKLYSLSQGFTNYDSLKKTIDSLLEKNS